MGHPWAKTHVFPEKKLERIAVPTSAILPYPVSRFLSAVEIRHAFLDERQKKISL